MNSSTGIEYVRCNLCGADDSSLYLKIPVKPQRAGKYNRDIWDIVLCKRCGLIYTNPQPDRQALDYFYTFDNPDDQKFVQDWFIDNADINRLTWQRVLRAMSRYCSSGRLLEVGCGPGGFLIEAQKVGFEVAGQDISPFFIDYCRSQLGLKMYDGELEEQGLETNSFDCISSFDVIEHHPDPSRLIIEMHRLLKPGGLVVMSTHDIGNMFARFYGKKWRYFAAVGHLTYFTRQTLARMLEKNGFRVIHQSGMHTVDRNRFLEGINFVKQFFRLIILRALILLFYLPLSNRIPAFRRWSIHWKGIKLDHNKLMMRVGKQIVMNDDMILLAVAA